MANKRMFNKNIFHSDAFIDMSHDAQLMYVEFCLYADDDGFVDNSKGIMKGHDFKPEHLDELVKKRFVLHPSQSVYVIKHWWLHNNIAKDRYKATKYVEEKNTLQKKDDGAYTEVRIQNVDGSYPQYRLDKSSIDKKNTAEAEASEPKNKEHNEFIPLILKEFESINPACKKMYGNKTQRAAAAFLYDTYGFERIRNIISVWLPKTNGEPFFPTITTPVQLQQKFAQLEAAVKKKHTEAGKSKNQVAF